MSNILRKLWKNKPKQWGPPSVVSMALRDRLEKLGIVWNDVAFLMPMWNPGDQLDYGHGLIGEKIGNPYFKNNTLNFGVNTSTDVFQFSDTDIGRLVYPKGTILSIANVNPLINDTFKYIWGVREDPIVKSGFIIGRSDEVYDGVVLAFSADGLSNLNSPNDFIFENQDRAYAVSWNGVNTNFFSVDIYGRDFKKDIQSDSAVPSTSTINGTIGNKVSGGRAFDGSLNMLLAFSSDLSDLQIQELSENPYQLWQPQERTIYSIPEPTVATPIFAPIAGGYPSTQTIAISTTTPSSTIHYTTNGDEPTTESPVYSTPISVLDGTLKAIAVREGYNNSAVASGIYSISGAAVGQTLSSTNGTWTNSPNSYSYQWERDGSLISGATNSTYLLVSADANTDVGCSVTATNDAGDSIAEDSNVISVVNIV